MPREQKKRGRREQQKRDRNVTDIEPSPKRRRLEEDQSVNNEPEIEVHGDAGDDFISFGETEPVDVLPHNQFYGLLEPEEQEYYANVNAKLSANDFESDDDRDLFIQAVHRETQGKEMKVASSQSCSRYLEKVIVLSNADQLAALFGAFLENLPYLAQHRFGSHCCETLFVQAAKHVRVGGKSDGDKEGSLESLFLQAVQQLEPNIGFLLTERFASHTIRILLLVLSGQPTTDESTKSVVASKRKEKLDVVHAGLPPPETRKVPKSFTEALRRLISTAVSSIDTTYLRALATHPIGNPILQLILRLELTGTKNSSGDDGQKLLDKLLPDEELDADSESGKFVQGLMYDPTGSHLVEALVQHLPGKLFKKLYKNVLKDRMGNLAKNDIASYVAIKALERIGKDDLAEARDKIVPEVQGLINRSRTGLLKILFERCTVRQVDTRPLIEAVKNAYNADIVDVLPKLLQFSTKSEVSDNARSESENSKAEAVTTKADTHGSLLAQAMLQTPGACDLIQQSILAQPVSNLVLISKNPTASRVLQVALASDLSTAQFRRQFIPKFYGHAAELAQDSAGSHIVDALWNATSQAHFMKERLAKELQQAESELRDSVYGRNVWKNWSMDTYTRRFQEWKSIAKPRDQDRLQLGDRVGQKTAIELARERHFEKARKDHKESAV